MQVESGAVMAQLAEQRDLLLRIEKDLSASVAESVLLLADALSAGNKLLIMGNGGSAADAQHFAAEMAGRFMMERPPLPAIALTTNTSILTAVGNDYGFDRVFPAAS